MAINLEFIESPGSGRQPGNRGAPMQLPFDKITNVTAAGKTTFTATVGKRYLLRNRAGGDSVYVRVQLADGDNATAANAIMLAAGESFPFMASENAEMEVDVRAVGA